MRTEEVLFSVKREDPRLDVVRGISESLLFITRSGSVSHSSIPDSMTSLDLNNHVRLVILGTTEVGKTSILSQFLHQKFEVSVLC